MPQLNKLFSDHDREAVNKAVQDGESGTSAEIVPVVAACSGRYDRPEDIIGLWFGLLTMAAVWAIYPVPVAESGHLAAPHQAWQLVALVVATVIGFMVGVIVGSRVDPLRRLFTPKSQMEAEVYSRARTVFFDNRVHHTVGSSGVLLYVSLFEHMAAVIADETVLQKIGQDKVDALCAEFTQRLHSGNPTQAMCDTIRSVGQTLSPLMPRAVDDVNELPDALLLLE
jgi:putative membrane protein